MSDNREIYLVMIASSECSYTNFIMISIKKKCSHRYHGNVLWTEVFRIEKYVYPIQYVLVKTFLNIAEKVTMNEIVLVV